MDVESVKAMNLRERQITPHNFTPHNFTAQEHKFFDSADWALNKEAAAKKGVPAPRQVPEEQLKPKLEPTTVPGRRISHLDSMEHKGDHPPEHKGSEGAQ
ncbi:hypothetical protein DUNSADRAFT_13147 [Dunaliella salina]|uniref:Encoded protein n=1 Tax=Dunaliella salina TaxID=3046 RepID=A0ABQ7GA11_DUNSA|nr:hypothetical protein DUNSADRAFT_13147 [Dunaliella salina]|eukprot:KAF5831439.1 hypothetical protein DUNSADRAFT_13147 [Dunaliella salina]